MEKSGRYIKNTRINYNSSPSYVELYKSGDLKKIGEELWENMKSCTLCPRDCKVDRLSGERGVCGADSSLVVAAFHPHFGEEKTPRGDEWLRHNIFHPLRLKVRILHKL